MNWKTAPNYENNMFMAFSKIRNTAQNLNLTAISRKIKRNHNTVIF